MVPTRRVPRIAALLGPVPSLPAGATSSARGWLRDGGEVLQVELHRLGRLGGDAPHQRPESAVSILVTGASRAAGVPDEVDFVLASGTVWARSVAVGREADWCLHLKPAAKSGIQSVRVPGDWSGYGELSFRARSSADTSIEVWIPAGASRGAFWRRVDLKAGAWQDVHLDLGWLRRTGSVVGVGQGALLRLPGRHGSLARRHRRRRGQPGAHPVSPATACIIALSLPTNPNSCLLTRRPARCVLLSGHDVCCRDEFTREHCGHRAYFEAGCRRAGAGGLGPIIANFEAAVTRPCGSAGSAGAPSSRRLAPWRSELRVSPEALGDSTAAPTPRRRSPSRARRGTGKRDPVVGSDAAGVHAHDAIYSWRPSGGRKLLGHCGVETCPEPGVEVGD